jgi:tyrosyl-tRNA synthetase
LRFFTDLTQAEVAAVEKEHTADPGKRAAQRRLAEELTLLVHGAQGLAAAKKATEILFGAEIGKLPDAQLLSIFSHVPNKQLARALLDSPGYPVCDALCDAALAKSKSEARRTIAGGGVYLNNVRVESADARLGTADLAGESVVILRSGRKNFGLLRFVE